MAIICPTITTDNQADYRIQMERVAPFADRIHIDLADGVFAPVTLTPLKDVWWPVGVKADLHLMYESVMPYISDIVILKPHMVIIHAESVGTFHEISKPLKNSGIKVGIALLQHTSVSKIAHAINMVDHVLIFSGDLGYFGGHAKMSLLHKVSAIQKLKKTIEIGWDGGINAENIHSLVIGGVGVLNTGGAIHNAPDPQVAYATLKAQI
jgi:ribulose-phosphate 3-epimerase